MRNFANQDNLVTKQAAEADVLLKTVEAQVATLIEEAVKNCKSILIKENQRLLEEVNNLRLFVLSLNDRTSEALIPKEVATVAKPEVVEAPSAPKDLPAAGTSSNPKAKAKKQEAKPSKVDSSESQVIDVGRLDFRVGHILSVEKHPDADSLYVEKIEVGEDKPRTVVSGLVKQMTADELNGQMVVLLCNLKPAKMRGVTSEAMVMCASTPEKVEVLTPPEGSVPGDLIEFQGYQRNPDAILNPKKKIFETCAPDLKTNSKLVATYKDVPFEVLGKGLVVAKSLSNVQIK